MPVKIKQRFELKPVILALLLYFLGGVLIYNLDRITFQVPLMIYGIYLFFCMILSFFLYKKDKKNIFEASKTFKRDLPFVAYGQEVHEYEYVFSAQDANVLITASKSILQVLQEKTSLTTFEKITITDNDKHLSDADAKIFFLGQTEENMRGNKLSYLLHSSHSGNMYSIHWWILVCGYVDIARVVNFIVFSPFSLPFWIARRLQGDDNIVTSLRATYHSFYNDMSLLTATRSINKVSMEHLAKVLNDQGVDVSDLTVQKNQIMNIEISGGKASFGSIVQGAINNVAKHSGVK